MIDWKARPAGQAADGGASEFLSSAGVYYGGMRDIAAIGLFSQINELALAGVREASAEIRIELPADADKSRIHAIRNHLKPALKRLTEEGFAIRELRTEGEINRALRVPAAFVMAAGETNAKARTERAELTALAGQEIVYAGWAGLEGMIRIIGEKEQMLRERFTPAFIRQMKAYGGGICGLPTLKAAEALGVSVRRQVSEGGILASLWELASDTGLGMELNMKRISILQETIEVCELFRLNPYQLTSGGSFLMLAENGEAVADALKRKGIQASVIGRLTDSNDKIMRNGEEIRYLDRPSPDELMKIF